jgi:hypothetical protein
MQGLTVTGVCWILAFATVYIEIQRPFMDGLVFLVYFVFGGIQLACVWWLVVVGLALAGKPWFKGALLIHTVFLITVLYLLANFSPLGGNVEEEAGGASATRIEIASASAST